MVERADLNSVLGPIATEEASLDDRVLAALASDEFEGLLNAERNFAKVAMGPVQQRKQQSEQMASKLASVLKN